MLYGLSWDEFVFLVRLKLYLRWGGWVLDFQNVWWYCIQRIVELVGFIEVVGTVNFVLEQEIIENSMINFGEVVIMWGVVEVYLFGIFDWQFKVFM